MHCSREKSIFHLFPEVDVYVSHSSSSFVIADHAVDININNPRLKWFPHFTTRNAKSFLLLLSCHTSSRIYEYLDLRCIYSFMLNMSSQLPIVIVKLPSHDQLHAQLSS